jgi:hypothetical protein
MSFDADIDRYIKKLNKKVKQRVADTVRAAYVSCIVDAPVDTGSLRYNFKAGLTDNVTFTEVNDRPTIGSQPTGKERRNSGIDRVKYLIDGSDIYIANATSYYKYLPAYKPLPKAVRLAKQVFEGKR